MTQDDIFIRRDKYEADYAPHQDSSTFAVQRQI
jgi:hypothetical protein